MNASGPNRRPLACGALGRYDRDRVLRAASALHSDLRVVHEEPGAILMLDRPPIEWSQNGARGLAWSERVEAVDGARLASWRDAATHGAACGLEIGRRRALLHSTVSGASPLYHLDEPGVSYFASRIDPLITAAPGRFECDWDCWASILTIGHAMGSRTPFREVSRLAPFSTLEVRGRRAVVSAESWPWAEVEPTVPAERAAREALAALRAAVSRLPHEPITCPLSGGWDSRLLLWLLVQERHADVSCVTVSHHDGANPEEVIAAEVARMFDVPHHMLASTAVPWWPAVRWGALQVDFQQPLFRWHLQLMEALRDRPRTIADGFGLDSLGRSRWVSVEAAQAGGSDDAMKPVWAAFTEVPKRVAAPAYTHGFRRALLASARRQYMAESERFAGHPSRAFLSDWCARQVRGTACRPALRLGSNHLVATPFLDHDVMRAALSATPVERADRTLYRQLFTQADPRLWDLRSTNVEQAGEDERATSRPTPDDARDYAALLAETPLAPHLGRRVRTFLARPRAELDSAPAAAYLPYLFALWYERYRDRISEPDPAELLT